MSNTNTLYPLLAESSAAAIIAVPSAPLLDSGGGNNSLAVEEELTVPSLVAATSPPTPVRIRVMGKVRRFFRRVFRRPEPESKQPDSAAMRFSMLPSIAAAIRANAPVEVLREHFKLDFPALRTAYENREYSGVTSFYNAGYSLKQLYDLVPYVHQLQALGLQAKHFFRPDYWSFGEFCQRWGMPEAEASTQLALSHSQLLRMRVASVVCYAASPEPLQFSTIYALKLSPRQVLTVFPNAAEQLAAQQFSEQQKQLLLRLGWDAEAVGRHLGIEQFQTFTLTAAGLFTRKATE